MTETKLSWADIIRDVQKRSPPVILAIVNDCRAGNKVPQWSIGEVIKEGQHKENCSSKRNCDTKIALNVQCGNVDSISEKFNN
jgi:hypothetical protein